MSDKYCPDCGAFHPETTAACPGKPQPTTYDDGFKDGYADALFHGDYGDGYEEGWMAGAAAQLEACEEAVEKQKSITQGHVPGGFKLIRRSHAIAALRASAIGGGK